jgi:uncharacterized linocin/CFP29 family protein
MEKKTNFIFQGHAYGDVASRLLACNFDVNCLRPWIGNDGRTYASFIGNDGQLAARPVMNVAATLRKDDWVQLDSAIVKAAMARLRAVADFRGAGLTYTIPNGMGKTVLETEMMSDIGDASLSLDALRSNPNDRPEFDLAQLPLPIIHKDFSFSARQIAASRNGGSPLDTSMGELAGRKVAEEAEKLLLGESSNSMTWGGGTIYGLTNFPSRITRTLTLPTATAWTAATLLTEVLAMRQDSQDAYHYGPWMLYFSSGWDQYLEQDFNTNYPNMTVRDRLKKIEGINDVRTLDYLSNYEVLLVQMSSDVARIVIGMDVTTVQWETVGGLQLNYKVMAIMVPQVRADFNSNCGLVHGTAA